MRKTLTGAVVGIAVLCGIVGAAFAGEPIIVRWDAVAWETNAAAVTVNVPTYISYGADDEFPLWLDTVMVDIRSGVTPTGTVKVATLGSDQTGQARTLLTVSGVTADAVYPCRDIVTGVTGSDISNVPARMPVFGKLRLTAYGCTNTGATLRVTAILTPQP